MRGRAAGNADPTAPQSWLAHVGFWPKAVKATGSSYTQADISDDPLERAGHLASDVRTPRITGHHGVAFDSRA
jgi:hypothetical protein